jgi:signal transduction histidine kinase
MKSLHHRLSLFLMASLAALITLGASILYPVVRNILIAEFDYALLAKARALTTLAGHDSIGINLAFTESPLAEFDREEEPEYFQVWLGDGTELARSRSLRDKSLPLRAGPESNPVFWNLKLPDGRPGRAVGIGFTIGRERSASARRQPDYTIATVFARDTLRLGRTLNLLLACLGFGGLALIAISFWFARRATISGLRPLQEVARKVTEVDARTLATRLPVEEVPCELLPVINQLNRLFERLQAAFERERRVSANIAHELGTPVTELRLVAEMATRWRDDPEAIAQFAQDALDISRQMEQIINTLLLLARSEAGQQQFHCAPVNVGELLQVLRRQFNTQISSARLDVEWNVPRDCVVLTDYAACEYILRNLLDNAVEYTPAGGRILCRVESGQSLVTIRLSNTNPGLTPPDLQHLFEPLWRRDTARSDRNHTGLGLTLVNALALALRFQVDFELDGDNLFHVVLRIPRPQAEPAGRAVVSPSKAVAAETPEAVPEPERELSLH